MEVKRRWSTALLLVILFLPTPAVAEPLRIMVPEFVGPEPISQHVRTTVLLELIKAFQAHDRPERGAWILYGQQPLDNASHASVVDAASWPSVRADLGVWGQVHQYDEGAVLQISLSLTPLLAKRQVRPELWKVGLVGRDGQLQVEKGLPTDFYEFEPLLLSSDAIVRFEDPQGLKLYATRNGSRQIGSLQEVMRFYEIYDDAMLITSGGLKGWVRTRPISDTESEAINFCKGMVRLLRGDMTAARHSFMAVLQGSYVPQRLRVHSLIYLGLVRELTGTSGREQFEQAYRMNRLDKDAASYLLMSRLADIARLQQQNDRDLFIFKVEKFKKLLSDLQVLYAKDDSWFNDLRALAEQLI